MKKVFACVCGCICICVCILFFVEYNKRITGDEELIKRARKELRIANVDKTELVIGGRTTVDDQCLIWFVSGKEYQAHSYTPIAFKIIGEDVYEFVHAYLPVRRGMDIYVLPWQDGYSIIINNEKCNYLQLTDDSGNVERINVDSIPFVYYYADFTKQYSFLDGEGNVLPMN